MRMAGQERCNCAAEEPDQPFIPERPDETERVGLGSRQHSRIVKGEAADILLQSSNQGAFAYMAGVIDQNDRRVIQVFERVLADSAWMQPVNSSIEWMNLHH
ncbi:hypothetical protein A5892_18990 [Halotalea alkalilenta]|uniref:Uncharacterized protein n=1 Tax=Halotalea alkalilenta TaxID=376489 RepID=A0A172YJE5_9GAMM|nr:hypothetical protein A5892_18990 [Halotalea alkalilenta]